MHALLPQIADSMLITTFRELRDGGSAAWAFVGVADCGRGLFARHALLPGQAICEYAGPRMPLQLLRGGEYVLQVRAVL